MTVAHITAMEAIQIAAAGGGLRLNSQAFDITQLIQIAGAGSSKRAMIILENSASLSAAEMIQIGAAGRGAVVFE